MNSFVTTKQAAFQVDGHDEKHQQKVLHNFKKTLQELLHLFRKASQIEMVYFYWVNRARRQFVMETKAAVFSDIVFEDRVNFEEHFLSEFIDLENPVVLTMGEEISPGSLTHYSGKPSAKFISLLPFINNGETIALTVIESIDEPGNIAQNAEIKAYRNALNNIINNYLEISDLYDSQRGWTEYEHELSFLETKGSHVRLIDAMLNTMQQWTNNGGISLITRNTGGWKTALHAESALSAPPLGLETVPKSITGDSIQSKKREFAVHFNANPKRLSPREPHTEGAALAIPFILEHKVEGVVLVYDENPLLFKESTKHKFINTVQLTSLKIQSRLRQSPDSIFTHPSGALIPEVWECAINAEIKRLQTRRASYYTWISIVVPTELSGIRTQLRLEGLKRMQKDLANAFNPGNVGIPGLIGFLSDYRYIAILQSRDEEALNHWIKKVKGEFSHPFALSNGKKINTDIRINHLKLNNKYSEYYDVISALKKRDTLV